MAKLGGYWQATERLRFGAHAGVTLNNPNGDAVDTRVSPARQRTDHWLNGGVSTAWLLLRG